MLIWKKEPVPVFQRVSSLLDVKKGSASASCVSCAGESIFSLFAAFVVRVCVSFCLLLFSRRKHSKRNKRRKNEELFVSLFVSSHKK